MGTGWFELCRGIVQHHPIVRQRWCTYFSRDSTSFFPQIEMTVALSLSLAVVSLG